MARGSVGKHIGVGLLGAAVGAIAGVLFAPRSGKETRKAIGRGVRKAERATVRELRVAGHQARRASRRLSWRKR